jgi:pimeloyl-ACP methyl ester carboxylesterase
MTLTTTEVHTGDGRRVEVLHTQITGRTAAVVHNGTPSGLTAWPWFLELADAASLDVVMCNRPGYGASSPRPGRSVAEIADDTRAVLDHLGVESFVSLGISGGGPHAFADGARLGGRCSGVVDVAGLAPPDLDGLDFAAGMGDDNRALFEAAAGGPDALQTIAAAYQAVMADVSAEAMLAAAPALFPAVDAAALEGPHGRALAEFFASMISAAFTSGTAGLIDDMVALTTPWGFGLDDVSVPVVVWHGELDENVPVAHGRAIADALATATTHFQPEHGHLSILLELPSIVDDLASLA